MTRGVKRADCDLLVELWKQGLSTREISEKTGADSKTVRRYAREAGLLPYKPPHRSTKTPFSDDEYALMRKWWDDGHSQTWIAGQFKVNSQTVGTHLRKIGIEPVIRYRRIRNGGRYTAVRGYIMVWVYVDDPIYETAAKSNRFPTGSYIQEHRAVMARHLGRPLTSNETVHHLNGDHADNRIENLQLRQGHHGMGERYACGDCGSHNIIAVEL